ncbi:MAG TPA: hypothetical protein VMS65_14160 [Polyangiaceae bacterium]|nr:hypothetical protein [Polyangiaceae bacterium]
MKAVSFSRTREKLARAVRYSFVVFLTSACGAGSDLEVESLSEDFQSLSAVNYPGFIPTSPPGSSCEVVVYPETRTLEAASRWMTWDYCGPGPGSAIDELQRGGRTLTEMEFASVREALDGVRSARAKSCIDDVGHVTLDLETSAGTKRYVSDVRSGCPEAHETRTFARGLVELANLLSELD